MDTELLVNVPRRRLETLPLHTFADYFRLSIPIEDVPVYFGYTFHRSVVSLRTGTIPLFWLEDLRERIVQSLPSVSLDSETARREFLIAPIMQSLAQHLNVQIRIEYPIDAGERLRGSVDYLLAAQHQMLVVEAKEGDLQKGFAQLEAEIIALAVLDDQYALHLPDTLYGAISTGNIWQFGVLERKAKRVTQDLTLYRVPEDLHELVPILVTILTTTESH